jgi:hypothetical protein
MASPWTRIEEGDQAKGSLDCSLHSAPQGLPCQHMRLVLHIEIEEIIDLTVNGMADAISKAPLQEESVFVKQRRWIISIFKAEIAYFRGALPPL